MLIFSQTKQIKAYFTIFVAMKIKMKNINKNSIPVFLLLIGVVLFLHSILPHDHHYQDDAVLQHSEDNNPHQDEEEPLHCHFLNELIFNKTGSQQNDQLIKVIPTQLLVTSQIEIVVNECLIVTPKKFREINPSFEEVFFPCSPTRGSPS